MVRTHRTGKSSVYMYVRIVDQPKKKKKNIAHVIYHLKQKKKIDKDAAMNKWQTNQII